ncbi:hypothetical protein B0J12DRAFT_402217 [Macrophomina phaseolina]|uniref:Uncharacterized protein n=1 Tax=Macrophomina phaseolina TaxID=35725 RepID=A0ABQ8GIH0_9PEZI|nr:hypothetical protein B0J12DRAFT_402217 [Macrophomina phaseolina]
MKLFWLLLLAAALALAGDTTYDSGYFDDITDLDMDEILPKLGSCWHSKRDDEEADGHLDAHLSRSLEYRADFTDTAEGKAKRDLDPNLNVTLARTTSNSKSEVKVDIQNLGGSNISIFGFGNALDDRPVQKVLAYQYPGDNLAEFLGIHLSASYTLLIKSALKNESWWTTIPSKQKHTLTIELQNLYNLSGSGHYRALLSDQWIVKGEDDESFGRVDVRSNLLDLPDINKEEAALAAEAAYYVDNSTGLRPHLFPRDRHPQYKCWDFPGSGGGKSQEKMVVDPDGSCSLHMVERVLESKGWAIEQIKKAMCQLAMPLKPDGRFYNYFGSVQESDKCRVARNLRALGDNLQVAATSKIEIRCDDPYCQCEPGLWAYRLTRKTYRSRSWEPNHIIYLCPAVSQRMLNHTDTLHEQDLSLLLMTELGQIRDVIRPPLTQQSGEGAAWSVVANYTHEWAVRSSWNLAYFAQSCYKDDPHHW